MGFGGMRAPARTQARDAQATFRFSRIDFRTGERVRERPAFGSVKTRGAHATRSLVSKLSLKKSMASRRACPSGAKVYFKFGNCTGCAAPLPPGLAVSPDDAGGEPLIGPGGPAAARHPAVARHAAERHGLRQHTTGRPRRRHDHGPWHRGDVAAGNVPAARRRRLPLRHNPEADATARSSPENPQSAAVLHPASSSGASKIGNVSCFSWQLARAAIPCLSMFAKGKISG